MRNVNPRLWLMAFGLALSACGTTGGAVKPVECPRLAPPSPSVMQPPQTEKRVRDELFKPQQRQTPR